jgi:putative membrane protein
VTDLVLAITHNLLVFSLAGILAAELAMIRPGLAGAGLKRLGIIDAHYGLIAGLIIAVGFARVFYGIKGPDFYLGNHTFWAKIAAFLVVGLLSAIPTVRILQWRRRAKTEPDFAITAADVAGVRRFLVAEVALFALIPIFAAAMARGYGG